MAGVSSSTSGAASPSLSSTPAQIGTSVRIHPSPPPAHAAGASHTYTKKLDLKEIFAAIGMNFCLVSSARGKSTGFLPGGSIVLVPFHVIAVKMEKKLPDGRADVSVLPIEIIYQDVTYTAYFAGPLNLDLAQYYDLCSFEIMDRDFSPPPTCEFLPGDLSPGEKVYFGGYPLTQVVPTFHKGIVSSSYSEGKKSYFTIDGTTVPGNSGGPVFIQRDGKLYLVGILFAQVADVNPDFVQAREQLKARLSQSTMSINGVSFNHLLSEVVDTMFNNLSTGIGKALYAKHIMDLKKTIVPEPPTRELDVYIKKVNRCRAS